MTAAVLDRPADLSQVDSAIPCAMHEIALGKPPCGRMATLRVRVHGCQTAVSCKPCWHQLVKFFKAKHEDNVLLGGTAGGWRCASCGKTSKIFDDLIWSEPL